MIAFDPQERKDLIEALEIAESISSDGPEIDRFAALRARIEAIR